MLGEEQGATTPASEVPAPGGAKGDIVQGAWKRVPTPLTPRSSALTPPPRPHDQSSRQHHVPTCQQWTSLAVGSELVFFSLLACVFPEFILGLPSERHNKHHPEQTRSCRALVLSYLDWDGQRP